MRGNRRAAMVTAALLVVTAAITAAYSETDTDKTEPATGVPAPPATPEITILNKHEVEGILSREVRSTADKSRLT